MIPDLCNRIENAYATSIVAKTIGFPQENDDIGRECSITCV